jgi:hypothetical protein
MQARVLLDPRQRAVHLHGRTGDIFQLAVKHPHAVDETARGDQDAAFAVDVILTGSERGFGSRVQGGAGGRRPGGRMEVDECSR